MAEAIFFHPIRSSQRIDVFGSAGNGGNMIQSPNFQGKQFFMRKLLPQSLLYCSH
ncbi:hypothetical protein ABE073_16770 [Lederbergia citrisecunda]|uniref:hypothetical protein n=1 Tax=Lederbergia citrisecunda TaxID=2833583 RepID=UPI003D27108E